MLAKLILLLCFTSFIIAIHAGTNCSTVTEPQFIVRTVEGDRSSFVRLTPSSNVSVNVEVPFIPNNDLLWAYSHQVLNSDMVVIEYGQQLTGFKVYLGIVLHDLKTGHTTAVNGWWPHGYEHLFFMINDEVYLCTVPHCHLFNTTTRSFESQQHMRVGRPRQQPTVVMINNEPCIVGGYWEPLSIECLNTETMRWYVSEATPKRRRTAHASIVHDGILYMCSHGYNEEDCQLYNITSGSQSSIPFTHLYTGAHVHMFVENNQVFAMGFTRDDDGIESVAIVDVRQDVVIRHYKGPFMMDLFPSMVFIKPCA